MYVSHVTWRLCIGWPHWQRLGRLGQLHRFAVALKSFRLEHSPQHGMGIMCWSLGYYKRPRLSFNLTKNEMHLVSGFFPASGKCTFFDNLSSRARPSLSLDFQGCEAKLCKAMSHLPSQITRPALSGILTGTCPAGLRRAFGSRLAKFGDFGACLSLSVDHMPGECRGLGPSSIAT